jgi:hypothetical protein
MGTILLSMLLETAEIEVPVTPESGRPPVRGRPKIKREPAFSHEISWTNPARMPETRKGGTTSGPVRRYGVISAHPEVLKAMLQGSGVSAPHNLRPLSSS